MPPKRVRETLAVVNVIPAEQVVINSLAPFPHVLVRERQDGSWVVSYPDPGFIPCSPVCRIRDHNRSHKCDYDQAFIETNYKPTSYDDAMDWATKLAEGRPVKVSAFKTLSERNAARAAEKALTDAA